MDEVEKLINNLTSDRSQTRTDAAFELGRRREGRAVEPLIKVLQDDHEFVRAVAAEALGNIRDKRAEQPLSEALKDPKTAVAEAAAEALRALDAPIKVPQTKAPEVEEPETKQEVQVEEAQEVVVPTETKVILAVLALIATVLCGTLPLLQVAGLIAVAMALPEEAIPTLLIIILLIAWGVGYTRLLKGYADKS